MTRKWIYDHNGESIKKKDVPSALNEILQKDNFTQSIISGFRCCGLYPFNPDNVNYEKCLIKTQEYTSEDANEGKEETIVAKGGSCYQTAVEQVEMYLNNISVLDLFKNSYATCRKWEGDIKFAELYKYWQDLKDKMINENVPHEATTPLDIEETNEDEIFEFPFPEWNSSHNVNNKGISAKLTMESTEKQGRINVIQNVVVVPASTNLGKNPSKLEPTASELVDNNPIQDLAVAEEINISHACFSFVNVEPSTSKTSVNVLPGIDELTQDLSIFAPKFKNNNDSTISQGSETITVKASNTTSAILKDVLNITKPMPRKRIRKTEKLPSVLTSNEWISLKEAKEKEAFEKEEAKQLKKKCKKDPKKSKKIDEKAREDEKSEDKNKSTKITKKGDERGICKDAYVIVQYDKCFYPALVLELSDKGALCKAMEKTENNNWKWPEKDDIIWYKLNAVMEVISPPIVIQENEFCVKDIKDY